jgi:hypothetical protein
LKDTLVKSTEIYGIRIEIEEFFSNETKVQRERDETGEGKKRISEINPSNDKKEEISLVTSEIKMLQWRGWGGMREGGGGLCLKKIEGMRRVHLTVLSTHLVIQEIQKMEKNFKIKK